MRHVARMPDHAHRFVNYLYRYRCLSQLLIAPIEARRGMLHAMRHKGIFPHVRVSKDTVLAEIELGETGKGPPIPAKPSNLNASKRGPAPRPIHAS